MEKPVHFRRCHMCGEINHVEGAKVEKCSHCHRSLAPFYYYDDRYSSIPSIDEPRPDYEGQEYYPILGLTAYWETF